MMQRTRLPFALTAAATLVSAACSTVRVGADYDHEVAFAGLRTYDWVEPSEADRERIERVDPFLERRLIRAVDEELAARGLVRVTDDPPDFWVDAYAVTVEPEDGYDGASPSQARPLSGFSLGLGYPGAGLGYPGSFGYGRPGSFGYGYPGSSGAGYGGAFGFGYAPFGARGFGTPYFGYPGYGGYSRGGAGYPSYGGYGAGYSVGDDVLLPGTVVVDVLDADNDELIWRGWADRAVLEAPAPAPAPAPARGAAASGSSDRANYIREVVGKILEGFPPSGAAANPPVR